MPAAMPVDAGQRDPDRRSAGGMRSRQGFPKTELTHCIILQVHLGIDDQKICHRSVPAAARPEGSERLFHVLKTCRSGASGTNVSAEPEADFRHLANTVDYNAAADSVLTMTKMRNNPGIKLACCAFGVLLACTVCQGQDLTPRAYVITPIHSNAVVLTDSFFSGNLAFNGAVPITDATAKVNAPILSLYHSLNFFGHSANITASLPYGVGNFEGTAFGKETNVYRSGLFDSVFRFAVNLKGGPAMDIREFRKYQQKTVLGVSLKVVAPTGQYDPRKLINYGANRWAFKPEFGYSRRFGHWIIGRIRRGLALYQQSGVLFAERICPYRPGSNPGTHRGL